MESLSSPAHSTVVQKPPTEGGCELFVMPRMRSQRGELSKPVLTHFEALSSPAAHSTKKNRWRSVLDTQLPCRRLTVRATQQSRASRNTSRNFSRAGAVLMGNEYRHSDNPCRSPVNSERRGRVVMEAPHKAATATRGPETWGESQPVVVRL